MKIDPIQVAFDNLNQSIKNTARDYKEGRDILIKVLHKNTYRSEYDIISWLREKHIEIKDLDNYKSQINIGL